VAGLVFTERVAVAAAAPDPGAPDPDAAPLPAVRVVLMRDGRVVRSDLSDEAGRVHFRNVPPGEYEVLVPSDWVPPGWELRGAPSLSVVVRPGERAEFRSLGLGPRRRPVIKTFDGSARHP
jgi:hypothetical protein